MLQCFRVALSFSLRVNLIAYWTFSSVHCSDRPSFLYVASPMQTTTY